jgi:hypothetical protein
MSRQCSWSSLRDSGSSSSRVGLGSDSLLRLVVRRLGSLGRLSLGDAFGQIESLAQLAAFNTAGSGLAFLRHSLGYRANLLGQRTKSSGGRTLGLTESFGHRGGLCLQTSNFSSDTGFQSTGLANKTFCLAQRAKFGLNNVSIQESHTLIAETQYDRIRTKYSTESSDSASSAAIADVQMMAKIAKYNNHADSLFIFSSNDASASTKPDVGRTTAPLQEFEKISKSMHGPETKFEFQKI